MPTTTTTATPETRAAMPRLRLEFFFAGRTRAWGIFEDRFGRLRRQFTAEFDGVWDGSTLLLAESIRYADGADESRTWQIGRDGEDGYVGRCADVIGAARGTVRGNALAWSYDFRLRIGGRDTTVRFDDRYYLQPGGVLINRARMSKWGIALGEASLFFVKPDGDR